MANAMYLRWHLETPNLEWRSRFSVRRLLHDQSVSQKLRHSWCPIVANYRTNSEACGKKNWYLFLEFWSTGSYNRTCIIYDLESLQPYAETKPSLAGEDNTTRLQSGLSYIIPQKNPLQKVTIQTHICALSFANDQWYDMFESTCMTRYDIYVYT